MTVPPWVLPQETGERSVRPLHRHVFHVEEPTLAFVGLPFKVRETPS
jgi:hypothetical protein